MTSYFSIFKATLINLPTPVGSCLVSLIGIWYRDEWAALRWRGVYEVHEQASEPSGVKPLLSDARAVAPLSTTRITRTRKSFE